MDRINAYSKPSPDGGITIDVKGMALDLITICKATGATREDFLTLITQIWDECEVVINIPEASKN